MNVSSNINLIKTSSGLPEYMVPLQSQYRNLSILTLLAVTVSAVATLSVYLFFQVGRQVQLVQKAALLKQLESEKVKENLFLAIKSRIGIVEEVMSTSHAKSILITNATDVALPPQLESISENEKMRVSMLFNAGSVEDAISMSQKVLSLFQQKRMKNVMMNNFAIDKNGISVSFDYSPVWE